MTTVGYDIDAGRRDHGDRETIDVSAERYETIRETATANALGGARVILRDGDDRLFVFDRDDQEWDVPGGAREPGERPEETARREVREEVGLSVELAGVRRVVVFRFVHDDRPPVSGLWVWFAGRGDASAPITLDRTELADARWTETVPTNCNRHAVAAIDANRDTSP